MRNKQWIKAALLTATLAGLAVPSLAQRGGDGDGDGRRGRGGGEARSGSNEGRGGRSDNGGGERGGGNRGDANRQQQSAPAPVAAPQAPPVMDNPRAPRPFTQRPGMEARDTAPPVQPSAPPVIRNGNGNRPGAVGTIPQNNIDRDRRDRDGRVGNRNGDNDRRDRDNDGRADGRGQDRADRDRDQRDRDWRDNDRDRNDRDRDWRGNGRPSNAGRPHITNRWKDYPSWTNDWRRDNRYNWQGWRNSNRDIFRLRPYYAPFGWNRGYFRFSLGSYLDDALFGPSYWIDDPYRYRLPSAYGTLRWVRYYDDALLIDIRDGYVVDVIHDVFW